MCVDPITMMAVGTTVAAGAALYSGFAANAAGKAQARVARQNAQMERQLAGIDEAASRDETRSLIGQQIANDAASGISPDSLSSLEVLEHTVRIGERNALAIRAGGQQRAWNYQAQGAAARAQGKSALVGSALSATGQLISGAGSAGYRQNQLQVSGAG